MRRPGKTRRSFTPALCGARSAGFRLLVSLACLGVALPLLLSALAGRAASSQVRVEIWNGNGEAGMAQEASEELGEGPFRVVRLGDAPTFKYGQTFILYRSGYEEAARQLASSLPVKGLLRQMGGLPVDVDIRLLLGKDYAWRMQEMRQETARAEARARAEAEAARAAALARAEAAAQAEAREREQARRLEEAEAQARELALEQTRAREAARRREESQRREEAARAQALALEEEARAEAARAEARAREQRARQETPPREEAAARAPRGRTAAPSRRAQAAPLESPVSTPSPALPRGLRVELSNGNGVSGMASRVRRYLDRFGIAVSSLSNADSFDYRRSAIFYRPGLEEEARVLASMLPVGNVALEEDNRQGTDLRVVLGLDLVAYDINRLREESLPRAVAGN